MLCLRKKSIAKINRNDSLRILAMSFLPLFFFYFSLFFQAPKLTQSSELPSRNNIFTTFTFNGRQLTERKARPNLKNCCWGFRHSVGRLFVYIRDEPTEKESGAERMQLWKVGADSVGKHGKTGSRHMGCLRERISE